MVDSACLRRRSHLTRSELRVPRDREGRFSTELFDRYQRSEKARVSALAEMYVQAPTVTWIVT